MGLYRNHVLPRVADVALSGKEFTQIRTRVTASLRGRVLEVGFGSGRNVSHYPPAVEKVYAVDPATVGRRLARKRLATSSVPVEFVGLDGERLPLDDESVDHVLTTWTLCTIPDVEAALSEILRVLPPGGCLHFAEHGRAPDPKVARRQDRFTPIQRRMFGGCHLNRPIEDLITGTGFEMVRVDSYYAAGPRLFGYTYEGIARRPGHHISGDGVVR